MGKIGEQIECDLKFLLLAYIEECKSECLDEDTYETHLLEIISSCGIEFSR